MYEKLARRSLRAKILFVVIALIVLIPGGLLTEANFGRAEYPGAAAGGIPLTFDLDAKEADLTSVRDGGRLGQLVITQYYDLGIIIGTLLFFPALTLLLVHPVRDNRLAFGIGRVAFIAFLIAPTMDFCENVFLLILTNDLGNRTISLINSIFTFLKIGFFVAGWALLLILLVLVVMRALGALGPKAPRAS